MKQIILKTSKFGARPWIYRKMLSRPQGVEDGEIVELLDPENRFVGYGFYNSQSEIALRIVHRGAKREIDAGFFRERLREAIYLRRNALQLDRITNAYRVVNSEGDGMPGLIVDRYGDTIALSFQSYGFFRHADTLRGILSEEFGGAKTVIQVDDRVQKREGFRYQASKKDLQSAPPRTLVQERGIKFHVDFRTGHKTGFFCDQRDNRETLSAYCKDKNVLDACCYTGGFSLYAKIRGSAGKVVGVDLDEDTIAVAKENAKENGVKAEFVHADAFHFLREQEAAKAHWDVVVLDPPKLAVMRSNLEQAEKNYKDLNFHAMCAVKNGGLLLTCSCSGMVSEEMFLAILRKAAARAGRKLQILKISGAAPDHAESPNFPESRYLKAVLCTVRKE